MTHRQELTYRPKQLGAALAALFLCSCAEEARTPTGERLSGRARPLPVAVATIEQVDHYEQARTYTGLVRARQSTDLAFEVGGKILALSADVGTRVEKGQVLARLDQRRLGARRDEVQARLDQARATLAEMRAGPRAEVIEAARSEVERLTKEVRLAGLQLGRQRDLLRQEIASQEDVDVAQTRLQTAQAQLAGGKSRLSELVTGTRTEQIQAQEAQVKGLDAQLAQIGIEIDDCELHAPFAGSIAARLLDPGAIVEVGRPVFRLVETDHLEAWVGLPPKTAARLRGDEPVELEVSGHTFKLNAARVLPELDSRTRTATLVFELPTDAIEKGVRPGNVARLRVDQRVETAGYWLPLSALTESTRGLWSCFVLGENADAVYAGSFELRLAEVEVLHVNVDRALVRGTLKDGDQVLSGGTQRVVAGQLVSPTRASKK